MLFKEGQRASVLTDVLRGHGEGFQTGGQPEARAGRSASSCSQSMRIGPPVSVWLCRPAAPAPAPRASRLALRWQPWAQRERSSSLPHTRTRQCRNTSWWRGGMNKNSVTAIAGALSGSQTLYQIFHTCYLVPPNNNPLREM